MVRLSFSESKCAVFALFILSYTLDLNNKDLTLRIRGFNVIIILV